MCQHGVRKLLGLSLESMYDHENTYLKSVNILVYAITSSREHEGPTMMLTITPSIVDMLIVIVSEIFDMFHSLKSFGIGVGL